MQKHIVAHPFLCCIFSSEPKNKYTTLKVIYDYGMLAVESNPLPIEF